MDAIAAAFADVIRSIFTDPRHVGLLVSFLANIAMAWFIVTTRREDREDRKAFIETLNKLNSTLTDLRISFAAAGIKG